MEIRKWHYYFIFNCFVITYLEAKTFSLNEAIAAESQQKEAHQTTPPSELEASPSIRHSLLNRLESRVKASRVKNFLKSRHSLASPSIHNSLISRLGSASRVKNFLKSRLFLDNPLRDRDILSPLKYKKKFLIKSPLKPKKLKLLQKSRYRRKNQSVKREINGNEQLKQKYIPLLKSLSMLFDDLLGSDTSESYEVSTKKFKRNRFYSEDSSEVPRNSHQSNSGQTESKSQEKTITTSPALTSEITLTTEDLSTSTATSTTANYTTTSNFSTFRQNKNIPLLLPRNSFSSRRNDNGIGERSGTSLHGDIEGNITRHHGNYEHVTGVGENESGTEDDEKIPYGVARHGAGGLRPSGVNGNRYNTGILPRRNGTGDETISKSETTDDRIREIQFQTGRNETESPRLLQESIRRLRGFTSEDVEQTTEYVQPEEIHEESVVSVAHNNTSYQRVTDGGSSIATEDQKVRTRNETINATTAQSDIVKKKTPVVMIFDGYSIARHKNGQNKFSEKSIRLHS